MALANIAVAIAVASVLNSLIKPTNLAPAITVAVNPPSYGYVTNNTYFLIVKDNISPSRFQTNYRPLFRTNRALLDMLLSKPC